ncbi:hypothetical protein J6590_100666 [Homalodisca vitripennis]|nr:hypothetical protein J6590_044839 [Homalodisca vitripennis]KAG8294555.1 hypothetical protein J6590_100666 [Homalodisca vitripennis]
MVISGTDDEDNVEAGLVEEERDRLNVNRRNKIAAGLDVGLMLQMMMGNGMTGKKKPNRISL